MSILPENVSISHLIPFPARPLRCPIGAARASSDTFRRDRMRSEMGKMWVTNSALPSIMSTVDKIILSFLLPSLKRLPSSWSPNIRLHQNTRIKKQDSGQQCDGHLWDRAAESFAGELRPNRGQDGRGLCDQVQTRLPAKNGHFSGKRHNQLVEVGGKLQLGTMTATRERSASSKCTERSCLRCFVRRKVQKKNPPCTYNGEEEEGARTTGTSLSL